MINNITGILLAGGTGSRLLPFTKIINKHLLPVYNKPMIFYPLKLLQNSGITDIIIVVNGEDESQHISTLLGLERDIEFQSVKYVFQEKPIGTAHAVALCKDLLNSDSFIVIWGDNIFEYSPLHIQQPINATVRIFVKEVNDVSPYGNVIINNENDIIDIIYGSVNNGPINKGYALTGLFVLSNSIFNYFDTINPNSKNEIDLVDVLKEYIKFNEAKAELFDGFWIDAASSFDNLLKASSYVRNLTKNSGGSYTTPSHFYPIITS